VAQPFRIEVAGETNVGRKRNHNEDNFAIMPDFGLFLVADGMGGHASGEVASKMAVDAMQEFFSQTQEDPERTWPYKMDRSKGYEENRLITGIKLANLRIYETAQRESKKRGMGTTFVSMFTVNDGIYVAHVGDSRAYRFRDGKIEALTEDHSLLNDYIKMKRLTAEEIANFPHKNVIVRALGMKDTVKVDTRFEVPAQSTTSTCSARTASAARSPTIRCARSSRSMGPTSRSRPTSSSRRPTRTAGRTTSPPSSCAGRRRRAVVALARRGEVERACAGPPRREPSP
jgi:serine/threonine protein phosphatase PrpC